MPYFIRALSNLTHPNPSSHTLAHARADSSDGPSSKAWAVASKVFAQVEGSGSSTQTVEPGKQLVLGRQSQAEEEGWRKGGGLRLPNECGRGSGVRWHDDCTKWGRNRCSAFECGSNMSFLPIVMLNRR